MSLLPNEERPKLKAKRFNKFEPSSAPKIEITEDLVKRGFKRSITEDDGNYCFKPKRICTAGNFSTPSPTKNLAQNRLKNLKDQIQASMNSKETETTSQDVIEETINEKIKSLSAHTTNDYGKLFNKGLETNGKQKFDDFSIYKELNYTPLNASRKNLANARLQNIKMKLNSPDCKIKSPSVSNTDQDKMCSSIEVTAQCSTWTNDGKVRNMKRNITNITNTCNYDLYEDSPKCKKGTFRNTSPTLNFRKSFNTDTVSSTPEKLRNSETQSSSSGVPKTLDCMKKSSVIREENCNTSSLNNREATKKFSETTPDALSLPKVNSDNFHSKMERTASWIRSNQIVGHFKEANQHICESLVKSAGEGKEDIKKFNEDTDDMEWTNAEPDDEVVDPNQEVNNSNKLDKIEKEVIKDPEKIKDVCVVVDTNVFISGLSKIQDIVNLKTTGSHQPIIFVPWMVITELDYMKDSCSNDRLSRNIINAIKFINRALKEKNPRVVGQTVFEVDKQKHIGSSPDDKIIACCLQVAEKYENVILLSNDMNLKNKAMINDITACSSNEVMIKLMSKLVKSVKLQRVMHKMGIMCSSVICDCMKETYGNVWLKMDMMSHPPWSLLECLRRFKKYWNSVFKDKLMKQFTKTVHDLQELIGRNKCMSDDSEEFIKFMKLCVTLCIFLKDIEECRGFVENTLNHITKVP